MFVLYLVLASFAGLFLFFSAGVQGIEGFFEALRSSDILAALRAPWQALVIGSIWAFHWRTLALPERGSKKSERDFAQLYLFTVTGMLLALFLQSIISVRQPAWLPVSTSLDGFGIATATASIVFAFALWFYHLRLFRQVNKA